MILVVDTSVAVKWFVDEPDRAIARQILEPDHELLAPDFLVAETANVLWRRYRQGDIAVSQVQQAMQKLPHFFDELVSASALVTHALELAGAVAHSVYDCLFLALAIQTPGARLITADGRFLAKVGSTEHLRHLLPLSEFASKAKD